jgi:hypothetical protein
MKGIWPFRLGLILVFLGSASTAIIFASGEKANGSVTIYPGKTAALSVTLDHSRGGVGYYVITVPNYSKYVTAFVKVTDSKGQVIGSNTIATKMSVNYFEFTQDGMYTLTFTNASQSSLFTEIDFGNAMLFDLIAPFLTGSAGLILVSLAGYRRLRNYNISQPA